MRETMYPPLPRVLSTCYILSITSFTHFYVMPNILEVDPIIVAWTPRMVGGPTCYILIRMQAKSTNWTCRSHLQPLYYAPFVVDVVAFDLAGLLAGLKYLDANWALVIHMIVIL